MRLYKQWQRPMSKRFIKPPYSISRATSIDSIPWSVISFSLRIFPVRAFDSRAQGFSTPLARRRSSCPPPSPNLVRTHQIERYKALRDSTLLSLACRHPPEGYQIGARKRRAPGNTILSQPYRRRVSTESLNREGSQLAASLGGEPGPTSAGKTLPLIPRNQVSEGTRCMHVCLYLCMVTHIAKYGSTG